MALGDPKQSRGRSRSVAVATTIQSVQAPPPPKRASAIVARIAWNVIAGRSISISSGWRSVAVQTGAMDVDPVTAPFTALRLAHPIGNLLQSESIYNAGYVTVAHRAPQRVRVRRCCDQCDCQSTCNSVDSLLQYHDGPLFMRLTTRRSPPKSIPDGGRQIPIKRTIGVITDPSSVCSGQDGWICLVRSANTPHSLRLPSDLQPWRFKCWDVFPRCRGTCRFSTWETSETR